MKRSVTMMFAVSKARAKQFSGRLGAKVPISTPNPTLHMESNVILISKSYKIEFSEAKW